MWRPAVVNPILRTLAFASLTAALAQPAAAQTAPTQDPGIVIDHRYSNTDTQSLIGLPMGSHKTTVEKNGSLRWSQWSLKRRELDSPIGFSAQMDGDLAIQPFAVSGDTPAVLKPGAQTLYRDKYPFIVTEFSGSDLDVEELAFAVDPEQDVTQLPTANSGAHAFDVVRLTVRNSGTEPVTFRLDLSGRSRNLPGHADGSSLITRNGVLIAEVTGLSPDPSLKAPGGAGGTRVATFLGSASPQNDGFTLRHEMPIPPGASRVLWLRLPYDFPAARKSELSTLSGDALLQKAKAQWDAIWARGAQLHYPSQALNDFYQASVAWVLILTEYDAHGDLWILDGPNVYRQYWGRGEYFQARALEVAGYLGPARESVEHAFHIINDDGEWDGPPVSGWPAWDNIGGNAGAVWDYYQYTRDKSWLAQAYPYLLRSSEWVRDHREETTVENVASVPEGARPIRRMLTGSKCRPEPDPPLAPGERTYWYGLLPWSYGDSGLPEGHSYSHNFLSAFGIRVTAEAARVLGKTDDAAWLDKEYSSYTAAIRDSVDRAVKLEKTPTPYLPAQPTRPDAAYSQTFLAIWPTSLYRADDPLVTGLLTRMEGEESQGLPTNVAWAGYAGVWPGESMNMSETYLLRGEVHKNAAMLLAALNHTYTTDVFKEEILTDVTKERACDGPHSARQNMQGTGDMPEAWGNANTVDILRDMLVQERTDAPATPTTRTTLHLLAGLPADWIAQPNAVASIEHTPTTLGTAVSVKLTRTAPNTLRVEFDPGTRPVDTYLHVPLPHSATLTEVRMDGKPLPASAISSTHTGEQADVAVGTLAHRVTFDLTFAGAR